MNPEDVLNLAIRPALNLLPLRMRGTKAEAMLIAIGLQESNFEHRLQIGGPARGWWQFERAGVEGVHAHLSSRFDAVQVTERLGYFVSPAVVLEAIAHNDMLAAAIARLLLVTLPTPLPGPADAVIAWGQYLRAWRPGKPRPESWDDAYERAWEIVEGSAP